jgi:hypothetical protein
MSGPLKMFNGQVNPFSSFWMGGFECSDQLNRYGDRVDLQGTTGHTDLICEDYVRLQSFGIRCVREGIRWSWVEKRPYEYDFSCVRMMMQAAEDCGVQQVWDICHFGYPDDLSPLHPHFTKRFVALCEAFVLLHASVCPGKRLVVTPINEVSFISWLGGEVGGTSPFAVRNGWDVKYALMRAYIAGINAMKLLNPEVLIMTTEPLVNVVPPEQATEEDLRRAAADHDLQFQATDMLCGRICPELGGDPGLVDIFGYNYYYNNQWVSGTYEFLGWNDAVPDPRLGALSDLLERAYLRYGKPIVLSETSHPGVDRPVWIEMIARESERVLSKDVPFWGICLYPIIDRPDWDDLDHWHHAGLWDTNEHGDAHARILHTESAIALQEAQQLLNDAYFCQTSSPNLIPIETIGVNFLPG